MNYVIFPFALAWNILLTIIIIGLTAAWLSFVFSSVIGVILILLIDWGVFILPVALGVFYAPLEF